VGEALRAIVMPHRQMRDYMDPGKVLKRRTGYVDSQPFTLNDEPSI
jgi:hypothetical protein